MNKITLSLLVAVGLIGSASAQTPIGDLTNGLVSFYSFNGNANDSSGSGNNGTVYGATPTTDQFGNPNGAMSFNGVSDYITLPNADSDYQSGVTISVWLKSITISSQDQSAIDIPRVTGDSTGISLNLLNGYGVYKYNNISDNFSYYTPNVIADGLWHQMVASANGLTLAFYLDGSFQSSQPYTNNGVLGYQSVQVGRESPDNLAQYGEPRYFNGSINNVGLWNTALSSNQVSELYAAQSVPEPSTYALFGFGAIGLLMVMRRKKSA
jgi:hypothetical protein